MKLGDRLVESRYGWIGALATIGIIYLIAWSFDNFYPIKLQSPCIAKAACGYFMDSMNFAISKQPISTTRDLEISDKLFTAMILSFIASIIAFFFTKNTVKYYKKIFIIWSFLYIFATGITLIYAFAYVLPDGFIYHNSITDKYDPYVFVIYLTGLALFAMMGSRLIFEASEDYTGYV